MYTRLASVLELWDKRFYKREEKRDEKKENEWKEHGVSGCLIVTDLVSSMLLLGYHTKYHRLVGRGPMML